MLLKDEVIILSTVRYKDKNLIIRAYAKKEGIQSFFTTVSSGKSKRKDRNNYQVFSILELVSKRSSKSGLPRITESKSLHLLLNLRTDVGKNAMAFLLCEVLSKCIQEEEANPSLYQFVEKQIIALDECTSSFANFHLYFISQLTKHLGICPSANNEKNVLFDIKEGEFTKHKPPHSHYLNALESNLFQHFLFDTWEQAQTIKLSGAKRSYLLGQILKYYQYHVPGFELPKSLEILNEVFR
ncbi:MAG: DNA repair protein RecO (recombination protein O) [Saprospiraceae bacterium]|jgi:DNA repair protein RecO (recombination protein O)